VKERNREHRLPVEHAYPSVARWVTEYGWIEVGQDHPGHLFVRALDEGGLVWEGDASDPTVDGAFRALDMALAAWMREQLGE